MTGDEVYQIILDETGSEDEAQEAARQYETQKKILEAMQQVK